MLMSQTTDGILTRLIKKSKELMYTPDKHANVQRAKFNEEAFTPHIFEAHGNINYMHCSDSSKPYRHYKKLYPIPSLHELQI